MYSLKREIAHKYQVRQTNVNNNYIIVNEDFMECIINLCRFRFLEGNPVYLHKHEKLLYGHERNMEKS